MLYSIPIPHLSASSIPIPQFSFSLVPILTQVLLPFQLLWRVPDGSTEGPLLEHILAHHARPLQGFLDGL